jgi:transcriptional regulator with XRE-family HTH domain
MPAKPVFTQEQQRRIHEAALRVWNAKFKGETSAQKKMASALGVTQQTVSNLLKGSYRPGIRVASDIAALDGKRSLQELVGAYGKGTDPPSSRRPGPPDTPTPPVGSYANLTVCLQYFAGTRQWSPWTISAARAGFFGDADFAPPEWASRLDQLEAALESGREEV